MIKLKSMRTLTRTISKLGSRKSLQTPAADPQKPSFTAGEIKWELRPGGMLVQRRETTGGEKTAMITLKITSTVSQWHDITIGATSTFGELKMVLSLLTGLKPGEQRLVYRGKERGDGEHLHMVGVGEGDKVLLLEDPAIKEAKLRSSFVMEGTMMAACRSIRV